MNAAPLSLPNILQNFDTVRLKIEKQFIFCNYYFYLHAFPSQVYRSFGNVSIKLCHFFAYISLIVQNFSRGIFNKKMFFFPAGTSSANVESFFDNHAGNFSQKISRKIIKCCFAMEVYSIEIFIWTLRMRFCQPRQNVFPRYEKTFCAKSENPGKIEYGSKKSIFP